jgi:hypothetical protein
MFTETDKRIGDWLLPAIGVVSSDMLHYQGIQRKNLIEGKMTQIIDMFIS